MSITNDVRKESLEKTQPLGERQREVLRALYASEGGMTAWEIADRLMLAVYVVRPRLTELQKIGRVQAVGKKYYQPTDRNETLWKHTVDLFDKDGQGKLI